jgi:carotenoid cleavage dioxygenase-like enzyme
MMRYFLALQLFTVYVIETDSFLRIHNIKTFAVSGRSKDFRLKSSTDILGTAANAVGILEYFADSPEEVTFPRKLIVEGKSLPAWLRGSLIRNGPGLFGAPISDSDETLKARRFGHAFDGLAKISKYRFAGDGTIEYSARFIDSNWYRAVTTEGAVPPGSYTGPVTPPFSTKEKISGLLSSMSEFDNACVHVHQVGGEGGPYVATTDAPMWMEFDVTNLDTKGRYFPDKTTSSSAISLGGIELFSTAHPKFQGGYTYNVIVELRPFPIPFLPSSNLIHLTRTDASRRCERITSVEIGKGVVPYMHEFSITENYAVVIQWPLNFNLEASMSDDGAMRNMKWAGGDGTPTKIYVFDLKGDGGERKTPPVATFEAPPMFSYHHINAYEENSRDASSGSSSDGGQKTIVVDVCGYDTAKIVNGDHAYLFLENMRDPARRKLQERDGNVIRFRLPLTTSARRKDGVAAGTESKGNGTPDSPLKTHPVILPAINREKKSGYFTTELPTINEKYRGRRYRYSYGFTGFGGNEDDSNNGGYNIHTVVKIDHEAAEAYAIPVPSVSRSTSSIPALYATHMASTSTSTPAIPNHVNTVLNWVEPNCYPGEPVFVADPTGTAEDDGVLLVQVFDGVKKETFLLVLDARDMSELSRCYTGIAGGMSFHGSFFPNL